MLESQMVGSENFKYAQGFYLFMQSTLPTLLDG
jgi:hypothetical protein